jgi:hypothetical protein
MGISYILDNPVTVGDLTQQITLKKFNLVSVSLNFEDVYRNGAQAVLSVCLVEPDTNYRVNVVYQDAQALTLAQLIEQQIGPEILFKLADDGKLPSGHIVTE